MKYLLILSLGFLVSCGPNSEATLSQSLDVSSKRQDVFQDTASSIVACFFEYDIRISKFAEDSACGPVDLWGLKTSMAADYRLDSFTSMSAPGAFGPLVGQYQGRVKIAGDCAFDIEFTYSGEDIYGKVTNFLCSSK